jgi:hypothetical protein
MKAFFFLLITLLVFGACKSGGEEIISPIPEIELLSVSPQEVVAFRDSLVFQLRYTDGDGDLGSATEKNLFIVDERIDLTHAFRLQQIVPNNERVPITGTARVTLPNTLITDGSSEQIVTFNLYLRDQAGNESNRVMSPPIRVRE